MPRKKKSDSDTFADQLRQYEAELYRIAYVYVHNEQDALDIMQEAAPVIGNTAIVIVTADRSLLTAGEHYTIHCSMLQGHSKADAPLAIYGSWEADFLAP